MTLSGHLGELIVLPPTIVLAQPILTDAREVLGQKGHKTGTTLDPACPQVAPKVNGDRTSE